MEMSPLGDKEQVSDHGGIQTHDLRKRFALPVAANAKLHRSTGISLSISVLVTNKTVSRDHNCCFIHYFSGL